MTQEELIEKYLTNQLPQQERVNFEDTLEKIPNLEKKIEQERQLIDGIGTARKKELKNRLKATNISLNQYQPAYFAMKNFLLAGLSIGITSFILYSTIKKWPPDKPIETPLEKAGHITTNPIIKKEDSTEKTVNKHISQKPVQISQPREKVSSKILTQASKENSSNEPVPPTEDFDFMEKQQTSAQEFNQQTANIYLLNSKEFQTMINVELDSTHQRYPFHYRFLHDKLFLYGPFKVESYRLIAIQKNDSTNYLYYKGNYYTLSKNNSEIRELTEIQDNNLIELLQNQNEQVENSDHYIHSN